MTVITCHQPNLIPGASVVSKIKAADEVIWLDEVTYSHGGFTNRNKLPNGDWFTIPVVSGSAGRPINRVKIGEPNRGDWRTRLISQLRDGFPPSRTLERVCTEIGRHTDRGLVGFNVALLDILLEGLGIDTRWHFQSHLDGGRAVVAVSDDRAELAPISARLAMMVAGRGGTVYLSGPSGKNYLDETPFLERGVAVSYWHHEGDNPCALQLVREEVAA